MHARRQDIQSNNRSHRAFQTAGRLHIAPFQPGEHTQPVLAAAIDAYPPLLPPKPIPALGLALALWPAECLPPEGT